MLPQPTTTDSIIQHISDYGIGYSDATSEVTIPLIIALFAFGFPLLFTIITHINSKYESEEISRLFEKLPTYKAFWWTSYICIIYLLLFALSTLIVSKKNHSCVLKIFDYSSIAVAAVYAFCILSFAHTCIKTNNPIKLLQLVKGHYYKERRKKHSHMWRHFSIIVQELFFIKNDRWKRFHTQRERYEQLQLRYYANETYCKRLFALAKYAMKTSEDERLGTILAEVNRFSDEEETEKIKATQPVRILTSERKFYSSKFYSDLIHFYPSCPQNKEIEKILLMYLYSDVDRGHYPCTYDFVVIARSIIDIANAGRTSLIEAYIEQLQSQYDFIRRMPQNVYYIGGTIADIKHTETEAKDEWTEHCEIFFLMCAILFSMGEYGFIKVLSRGFDFPLGMLHPVLPPEILRWYISCRKKLQANSGYWNDGIYFGKTINEPILDRYVAALLLIFQVPQKNVCIPININDLQLLCQYRSILCQFEDELKSNHALVTLYPSIREQNVGRAFDESLESLRCQRNICFVRKETPKTSFISKLWNIIFSSKNHSRTHDTELLNYNAPISKAERDECERLVGVTDDLITRNLERAFIVQGNVANLRQLSLDPYTFTKNRSWGTSPAYTNARLSALESTIIWSRLQYLLLTACSSMKIKSYKVTYLDINDFLASQTQGNADDYVILDIESPFHFDSFGSEKKDYLIGIPNYRLDIQSLDFISHTELYKSLKGSLLLIPKDSMPIYERKNQPIPNRLSIENTSSEQEGIYAMRITINPNLTLAYNPNAEIIKIGLKE